MLHKHKCCVYFVNNGKSSAWTFLFELYPASSATHLQILCSSTKLLFFMYHTPNGLLFNAKLFVIYLHLCFFNLIWEHYVPGGTYMQRWYCIMVHRQFYYFSTICVNKYCSLPLLHAFVMKCHVYCIALCLITLIIVYVSHTCACFTCSSILHLRYCVTRS